MDQGVTQNLKLQYRKTLLLKKLAAFEENEEFQCNLLNALQMPQKS